MINYLRIGIITSIFGIKGEVKIIPTTDDINRFNSLDKIYIIFDNEYDKLEFQYNEYEHEVSQVKFLNDKVVLSIKNINTIDEANKILNKNIYIKRSDAIKLLDNEFYLADIIAKELVVSDNTITTVKDVMFTKANANLIAIYQNKEILIPMVKDFIDKIDLENNKIFLKNIDGLLDL